MSEVVLKVEGLSKTYRLGEVGTGTISHDLNRWWAGIRGKEDPYSEVGQVNDRTQKATSDYVNVLKDINFEVKQGEVLGVIGKNGAGKSTLLKLISRITAPTAGSIRAKGRIASLLEVGTGMNPEMTARENIYLNGTILGMTKKEISTKFDEIIDFAGCQLFVDTPVKRFSSGMRVRLGFAVAAFLEPEILIVDEVLAVGDAEFQTKAIGKMKEVSSEGGRTVLFVSHNMASIQHLCTSLLVLDAGGVDYIGDVRKGIIRYMSKNQKLSQLTLNDRKDRAGGVLFRFTDINLETRNGEVLECVATGEDSIFNIRFKTDLIDQKLIVRLILVNTENNNVVTVLNNNHTQDQLVIEQNEMSVKIIIPNFPFSEGEYYANIRARVGDDFVDEIENAFKFSVTKGDYYNTGKIPNMQGGVFMNQSWSIESIS